MRLFVVLFWLIALVGCDSSEPEKGKDLVFGYGFTNDFVEDDCRYRADGCAPRAEAELASRGHDLASVHRYESRRLLDETKWCVSYHPNGEWHDCWVVTKPVPSRIIETCTSDCLFDEKVSELRKANASATTYWSDAVEITCDNPNLGCVYSFGLVDDATTDTVDSITDTVDSITDTVDSTTTNIILGATGSLP